MSARATVGIRSAASAQASTTATLSSPIRVFTQTPPVPGPGSTARRYPRAAPDVKRALFELGGRLAQQLTGDDEQLDLLGALEQVEDLGVAGPLLHELALAEAGGAAQGHAAQGDVGPHPARLGLGHRRLQRVGLLVVGHPRRLEGE